MHHNAQRGASLVETVVAGAVAATVVAAALCAALQSARSLTARPQRVALQAEAGREMRVARDVLKYDGSTLVNARTELELPIPGSSPLAALVTLTTQRVSGATRVMVTATDEADGETSSVTAVFAARAPQPGEVVAPTALVPAPTGAP